MTGTMRVASNERTRRPADTTQGNLPIQLTPFIGREEVKQAVTSLLFRDDVRLLTLIGPPGIGKTRLAIQVASDLIAAYTPSNNPQSAIRNPQFNDGVWFVGLAPVTDPALVASSIAHALGLKQAGGRPLQEIVQDYLRGKHLLLVLDNFEQVVEAAPTLAELLSVAPGIKALVTSREALHVRGEQEFAVPPLTLPNLDHLPSAEQVERYEAVQLFAQRARSANLDFHITDDNALIIAAICWRLDGLPLAIELAAARAKLLPPQALFERLGQRLTLLTGGARDLPPRHRTLRSAIEWSYNLLDEGQRKLFRRLGVFVGGCEWEAIEAVCNADGSLANGTFDAVAALVDKSLVHQTQHDGHSEPRLMLLETLKEYALEQLEESGEAEEIRRGHALYFLSLAERANDKLVGKEGTQWLLRLEAERDNMRAALHWMRDRASREPAEAGLALTLAVALGRFWYMRGHLSEGRDWIASMLALPGAADPLLRARALYQLGFITYAQSDYSFTRSSFEESLAISRELGDRKGIALALEGLGEVATEEGDYISAPALFNESLAIARELGDDLATGNVLNNLGYMALRTGIYSEAVAPFEEALDLFTRMGYSRGLSFIYNGLGETALRTGDFEQAISWYLKSLETRQQIGDKWGVAISTADLGWVALLQGDLARATRLLQDSLVLRRNLGDKGGLAWCLEKLAGIAREQGRLERAVRLLGSAKSLRESIGSVIDPADQPEHDRHLSAMRERLGEDSFQKDWALGYAMTMDEAVDHALEDPSPSPIDDAAQQPVPPLAPEQYGGLTRREREVAALIAQSKSNAEIAEAMVVSKRTVETHITNILSKLGFTSRGQIAAWAIKKKLAPE